ncbi:hypothetical protein E2542_SST11281 [Spatholobus suberectus]|nr:hypothetical protein E2542_SST11281 [Spatholobus suberectus]
MPPPWGPPPGPNGGFCGVCIVCAAAGSWRVVVAQCLVDLLLDLPGLVSDHRCLSSIHEEMVIIEEIKNVSQSV